MQQKYESAVEKAAVEAFKKEYERIHFRICLSANLARRGGVAAVENTIDKEKAANGEPLEFGLLLVITGVERAKVEEYFDSWIEANSSSHCEYYDKILLLVIKMGILNIQSGANPYLTDKLIKALVPMELMPNWTEYYPEAVKQYGWLLGCVPDPYRTEELCLNAVKNCGNMLKNVPKKFKTLELCTEAIEQDGYALEYVPEEFKTEELCRKAVEKDGYALEFVPKAFKTKELCFEAVKRSYYAIKDVPKRLKTVELYIEVLKSKRKWWGKDFVTTSLKDLLDDDIPESLKNEVFDAVYKEDMEVEDEI